LKRTDFHIRVGKPFHLDDRGEKVTRQVREEMMEEMMLQLASLLPPEYRGRYANRSTASTRYIVFEDKKILNRRYTLMDANNKKY